METAQEIVTPLWYTLYLRVCLLACLVACLHAWVRTSSAPPLLAAGVASEKPARNFWPQERRAWAAPPCSQLNATEAQRLLYAQRWVERRTILPSLAEGISLVDR